MSSVAEIRKQLANHPARSAWNKGVRDYAEDLFDWYVRDCKHLDEGDEVTEQITDEVLLNGASNWNEYSYGGCSLVYDGDICKGLCSPSEQEKYQFGELKYRHREDWLDVQARALKEASRLVRKIANKGVKCYG